MTSASRPTRSSRSGGTAVKAAFFDRFSLVGFDTTFRVTRADVDFSASLGAHKALVDDAADSTAFDAAWLVGRRLSRRSRAQAGMALSLESVDHVRHSGFSRVYLAPGLDFLLTRRVALVSQLGLGLNSDSPNYLTAGVSFYVPVSGYGGEWR